MTHQPGDLFRSHAAHAAQGWEALAVEITTSQVSAPAGYGISSPINHGTRHSGVTRVGTNVAQANRRRAMRQAGIAQALADLCRVLAGE